MGGDERTWRPRRILVGYDGSEGGRDAVALAATLAEPDAEFLLVNVIPPVGIFTTHPHRLEDEEPPQSQGFFDEALEGLPGRPVETRTYVANSAARVLSEIAEEEGFDLIAIGPCYPGIVGRILIGSVGQGLMHGAVAPVAAAPRGYADQPPHRIRQIVAAYDGSPEAREAVAVAEVFARREAARLRLLTVDVRNTTLPGVVGWEPLIPKSPEEIVAAGAAAVAAGIEVEGRVISGGSIAPAIVADSGDADLLVVGSRGYGAVGRVLVGSVATGLLHRAGFPVLTVPRPVSSEVGSEQSTRQAARAG
ncbi:MAG TPA: universal stress protein [Solirubrobacterales bacterium]|nr:universal stress protein [Solirubrobacterales bacterium]